MKRQDIENAAKENVEFQGNLDFGTIIENACRESFVLGADWRINSVWNDSKDIPKESSAILAIRSDGSTEIVYFINILRWRSLIKRCGFVKWAYIKDLIPNKED